MKNSVLLLFSIFTIFASCSSDDDGGGSSSNDPIIGRWNIYQVTTAEGEVIDAYTVECIQNAYMHFTQSELTWANYNFDDNGNCVDATFDATWENRNGTYHINGIALDIEINGDILSSEDNGDRVTYRRAD